MLGPRWLQILAEQLLLASRQPADAPAADAEASSLLLSLDAPSRRDLHTKLMKTAVALYKFLQLGFRKLSANCRYISQWTDVMIQVCEAVRAKLPEAQLQDLIVGSSVSLVGGGANQPRHCSHVQRPAPIVRSPASTLSAAHSIGNRLGRLHDRHV